MNACIFIFYMQRAQTNLHLALRMRILSERSELAWSFEEMIERIETFRLKTEGEFLAIGKTLLRPWVFIEKTILLIPEGNSSKADFTAST
jgi:hypothetical protein